MMSSQSNLRISSMKSIKIEKNRSIMPTESNESHDESVPIDENETKVKPNLL